MILIENEIYGILLLLTDRADNLSHSSFTAVTPLSD